MIKVINVDTLTIEYIPTNVFNMFVNTRYIEYCF